MRYTVFLAFILTSKFYSQNLVHNGDFEHAKRNYITFIGKRPIYNDTFYTIDSFTYNWEALWGFPMYSNSSLPFKNGSNGVLYTESHPKAFRNNAAAYIYPNYKTKDTLDLNPIFFADTSGKYKDFNYYNGWYLMESSGFFQQLNFPLKKDTDYIVSYRLRSGNNILPNDLRDNNMSIFGILFSTNNIQDLFFAPNRRQYKIDNYRLEFQDTILDTTNRWRLIKIAFQSDSAYKFLNFAQFMDRKKYARYKIKTSLNTIGGSLKNFELTFPFYVDDVRLLPKWQYLDVSPDVNACEGDSVSLNVLSGSGPYKWILSSQPSSILSSAIFLKIKADTTSMFQVMSPYDTASIMVYVNKPVYDTSQITSCSHYLWRGKIRNTSGAYRDTAAGSNGCKVYYTLLFKRTIDNRLTWLDTTVLKAEQDSVSYQWYLCNPWTKLNGETRRTIKTVTGKTYAVVLNNGKGCMDTSDCITSGSSSIGAEEKLDWRVYPNPIHDELSIELDKVYKKVSIKMFDIAGKLLLDKIIHTISDYTITNLYISNGLYYLILEADDKRMFYNVKK